MSQAMGAGETAQRATEKAPSPESAERLRALHGQSRPPPDVPEDEARPKPRPESQCPALARPGLVTSLAADW